MNTNLLFGILTLFVLILACFVKSGATLFLVGHLRCDAILSLSLFADREGYLPRGLVIKYHGLAGNEWPGFGKPINELLTNGPVLRAPPEIIWDGGDWDDYHYIDEVADAYENLGDFVAHDAQYQDTRTLWQRIA